ncbi:phosphonate ABC transporter ATP-binding protein [Maritimibacter sp. 55A14]|uniref:phosphonate ABC transporter ATP-binding protein n=1 Tax=Maritimibacter sp. 55A14 TaxID=2174844 RepID=UPI001E4E9472|nr:ATP-binding cassette domain-containing protein [Maritimibacter sp. 55A14]
MVDIDDLDFAHAGADLPALEGVGLGVEAGEAVVLLGPSGAGKTTLLAILDGRLHGWTGRVSVLGRPLSPDAPPPAAARPDIGFIFQEFALVERSSVLRNVLNGRLGRMSTFAALLGRHSVHDLDVAHQAMADCGIGELTHRRVDSLSGGQRQRVAIARCLAQEPRLILADEPVSNLDPARAGEILTLITRAAAKRGATTIFSSHQPELALRVASRVVGMTVGRIAFDHPVGDVSEQEIAALYRNVAQDWPIEAELRLVQ